jgi:hypothetical protein
MFDTLLKPILHNTDLMYSVYEMSRTLVQNDLMSGLLQALGR